MDTGLNESLFYAHADFREEQKNNHISHETLITDAMLAEHSERPVNGVHRKSIMFELDYVTFDSVTYEPFHVFKNVCERLQNLLFAKTSISDNQRKAAIVEKIHPFLWNKNGKVVYELTLKEKTLLDALCNCIHIPKSYSKSYAMINPVQQNGYLTGIAKMNFFRLYLPVLLSFTVLPRSYRVFFSLFACTVNLFFAPAIRKDDIESLRLKAIELIAMKEGLFPNRECYVTFHQLIDLIEHVSKLGPFIGWNCLYGERMLGMLKKLVPDGGVSYDKVIAKRYVEKRNALISSIFGPNNHHGKGKSITKKFKKPMETYNRVRLLGSPVVINISDENIENLLGSIVVLFKKLITLQIETEESLLLKSSTYRLFKCSMYHRNLNNEWCTTFVEFLRRVNVNISRNFIIQQFPVDEHYKSIKRNVERGFLYAKDLNSIPCLLNNEYKCSRKLSLCSVILHGRGNMSGREDKFSNIWMLPKHSSSWIRYYSKRDDRSKNLKYTSYAQLNYIFRLHVENDEVLNFMSFSNVTPRESRLNQFSAVNQTSNSNVTGINIVRFDDQNEEFVTSMKTIFIPVLDILPTAVAFIPTLLKKTVYDALSKGFNNNYEIRLKDLLPSCEMLKGNQLCNFTDESKQYMITSSEKINSNRYFCLVMIDLHPEKIEFINNIYDPDIGNEHIGEIIDGF